MFYGVNKIKIGINLDWKQQNDINTEDLVESMEWIGNQIIKRNKVNKYWKYQ